MSVIDIAQTAGILLGLLFTIVQLKESSKVARVSIYATISERNDELTKLLIDRPEVFQKLYVKFSKSNDAFSIPPESALCYRLINFLDELLHYADEKFISESLLQGYYSTAKKFVSLPYIKGFWADVQGEYKQNIRLQKEMNRLLSTT